MILNNMNAYIAASILGKIANTTGNPVPIMYDINNTLVNGFAPVSMPASLIDVASFNYGDTNSTYNWKKTLWIGKDGNADTELSATNYSLNAFTTSEITGGGLTTNCAVTGNKVNLAITRTFTAGSADVTVKEIGLIINLHKGNGNRSNVLLARDVFDTPVTIPAGTSQSFTMAFTL